MFRLFTYTSSHDFSECDQITPLPVLWDTMPTETQVIEAAAQHGFTLASPLTAPPEERHNWDKRRTVVMQADTTAMGTHWNKDEHVRIAVAQLFADGAPLPIVREPTPFTQEHADAIWQSGKADAFHIVDRGELDGESVVVIHSWKYYQVLPLFGYVDAEDVWASVFDDSVSTCGDCGAMDHPDDGYSYNFLPTDDTSGEFLGVNCGCHAAAMESVIDDLIESHNDSEDEDSDGTNKVKFIPLDNRQGFLEIDGHAESPEDFADIVARLKELE